MRNDRPSRLGLIVVAAMGVLLGATSARAGVDHSAFDKILRENVTGGLVNYQNIKENALFDLMVYLDMLANAKLDGLSREEQLAYYLNLYNASMIRAVIERYHDGYSPAEAGHAVFKAATVNTGGRTISLDELENKIIRPKFQDARVHVALVCAARSCPPLLPRAYLAGDINGVLEQNMRNFVNDPARNTIDRKNKRLELSRVFEWYAEDFGGKDAVAEYFSRYVDGEPVEGFTITFREYDWTLNQQ